MSSVQNIVNKLAPLSGAPQRKERGAKALSYVAEVPSSFVWPNVREVAEGPEARILLIEAAGAVGKSATAKAIAATLGWPYIDTSKAQVGSYSLSGLIQDAFGLGSDFLARLASGRAGVLLDALDEAHLRAGTSNFEAFLDDVARLLEENSSSLSIVAFSRPDTAEIVKLHFETAGVAYSSAKIDYFDYEQSLAFIDSYMRAQAESGKAGSYDVSVKYRVPFEQLRDAQMLEIAAALIARDDFNLAECWGEVKNFLGYAPVLAVLAEFLAVPNPKASLSQKIKRGIASDAILIEIIENLLAREQDKFRASISDVLTSIQAVNENATVEDAKIYSADEQGVRLVAKWFGSKIVAPLPASLPVSLRETYENRCSQFISDHPFWSVDGGLVNIVFEDFVNARAAVDQACHAHLSPSPAAAVSRVGPFYHQFVYRFAPVVDGYPEISDEIVPSVIESHAEAIGAGTGYYTFTYFDNGDAGVLLLVDLDHPSERKIRELSVRREAELVQFPKRLGRGIIMSAGMVALGRPNERFFLGPSAVVYASEIVIEAGSISVEARTSSGKEHGSQIASAREAIQTPYLQSVDVTGPKALDVYSEYVWPVLQPYKRDGPYAGEGVVIADYMDLRAILRCFRQGAGAQPSVFGELLEQRIIKNSSSRKNLLRRLLELGYVSFERAHYYLHTGDLAEFGVNVQSVAGGHPDERVRRFIAHLKG